MARISKQEYSFWRQNEITEALMESVIEEMDNYTAGLLRDAGDDPKNDIYRRGLVFGLKKLFDWEPDFLNEETDGTESEGA